MYRFVLVALVAFAAISFSSTNLHGQFVGGRRVVINNNINNFGYGSYPNYNYYRGGYSYPQSYSYYSVPSYGGYGRSTFYLPNGYSGYRHRSYRLPAYGGSYMNGYRRGITFGY